MGRPRKIQTPGVLSPVEREQVAEAISEAIVQIHTEQVAAQPQEPADPNRPKRWVQRPDAWHYE